MKSFILALAPAALAVPQGHWWRGHDGPPDHSWGPPSQYRGPEYGGSPSGRLKAAYFLDNNPEGSSIVALSIGSDGRLSDPVRTSTGGAGSIGTNATGFPNPADSLMSQGSVVVSGNMLFTINAGSDTIVMFSIDPEDSANPQMVGEPVGTQGQFPMSVAYSQEMQMACVLNGGAKAGVSCFDVDRSKGLTPSGSLRSLGGTINETTPANGPPGSAGQILFDPQSKGVYALIKGDAAATPPKLGSVAGFAAKDMGISSEPIVSQFDNVFMDFSGTWLSDSRLFMTDPSFGIAYLDLQDDLRFTQTVHTEIPMQKAICWNVVEEDLDTGYAIDAGQNVIYTINGASGALTGNITIEGDGVNADAGIFDSALASGTNLLYSLTGGNGIAVTDVKTGKMTQYLDLTSFGDRQGYMGMALF